MDNTKAGGLNKTGGRESEISLATATFAAWFFDLANRGSIAKGSAPRSLLYTHKYQHTHTQKCSQVTMANRHIRDKDGIKSSAGGGSLAI